MKIGIASDHRGFKLKKVLVDYLKKHNYEVIDYGTDSTDAADYTKYGFILAEHVANKDVDYGIAICGSGIGISIACNKVKGIRCGKVDSCKDAMLTRRDNDANIIAFRGDMPSYKAKDIVDAFLNTDFHCIDRYINRIKQIAEYEEK